MKETLMLTDEAYRSDLERLWRRVRLLRDTTQYSNVSFVVQNWMLSCDGRNLASGNNAGADITPLFFGLSEAPTNGEMIAALVRAGLPAEVELPAMLTCSIEATYTRIN